MVILLLTVVVALEVRKSGVLCLLHHRCYYGDRDCFYHHCLFHV